MLASSAVAHSLSKSTTCSYFKPVSRVEHGKVALIFGSSNIVAGIQSELRQVRRDLAGDGTRKLTVADRLKRALSSLDSLLSEVAPRGVELSSSLLHRWGVRQVRR